MSFTEANPALKTEHATSAELGLEHTAGALTLGAALFWNELTDAVGNVTLAHGPGTFPIVGFVPAGGLGRQRLNLDRARVRGVELSAQWTLSPTFSVRGDWLANDATVEEASVAPALCRQATWRRSPRSRARSASRGSRCIRCRSRRAYAISAVNLKTTRTYSSSARPWSWTSGPATT